MKVTLDIPDDLVSTVISILNHRHFPEDDGMTDVVITNELNITVEQLVRAEIIVDNIATIIKMRTFLTR